MFDRGYDIANPTLSLENNKHVELLNITFTNFNGSSSPIGPVVNLANLPTTYTLLDGVTVAN